jgi:hypothetical protein
MVLQALVLIAQIHLSAQEALLAADQFGGRVDHVAPTGQPTFDAGDGRADLVPGRWEVYDRWGRLWLDERNGRVVLFDGADDPRDLKGRARWSEDATLSEPTARDLALKYVRLAAGDVGLMVEEDQQSGTCYSLSGYLTRADIPVFDSDVQVQVGHVSGCLRRLTAHYDTYDGEPPTYEGSFKPGISEPQAALAAGDALALGCRPTNIVAGPTLGLAIPRRSQMPQWFSNMRDEEQNYEAVSRCELVFKVLLNFTTAKGRAMRRLVFIDASDGRSLMGSDWDAVGGALTQTPIQSRVTVSPATIAVFNAAGSAKTFVTRLTRVGRTAKFEAEREVLVSVDGVKWIWRYDSVRKLLSAGEAGNPIYRPSQELAAAIENASSLVPK